MLPASARLTRGEDFRQVTRRGRRAGRASMVVHALTAAGSTTPSPTESSATGAVPSGPRVGFVVSKAVGNSVVRHRVTRRLRHLLRERIGTLPGDCSLVVRALPAAARSSSAELAEDLDAALTRLHLLARDGTA